MRPLLVCSDRDGTVNVDDDFYLGSTGDWRQKIEFMPGVIEGIQKINSLDRSSFYIVTNQAGVALAGPRFADLTEARMHEVNQAIVDMLGKKGCRIKGYFACPFVDSAYAAKKRERGRLVDEHYICDDHRDIKPQIGMLEKAARASSGRLEDFDLWVIGDRMTDIELALNGGGRGVLVASQKTIQIGDAEKTQALAEKNVGRVYIAASFLAAAEIIEKYRA